MKRLLLYAVILGLVFAVPTERADVAQLRPVEVIAIYKHGNTVTIATDTEDIGSGAGALEALSNMRSTSPAIIYLDTAQYLLIGENATEEVEALRAELKDTVQLCEMAGEVDLKSAAQYLPVHGDLPSLRAWEAGKWLPVLYLENGRLKISQNSEKSA